MPEPTMPDTVLLRHPAVPPGARSFGPVTLEALGPSTILQVLAPFGSAADALGLPGFGYDVRVAGPGQWLLVRDGETAPKDVEVLAHRLGSAASLVDQSHGRVRLRVSGPHVRDMLAKLVPLDLAPEVFSVGAATTTIAGHVGIHFARTGEDTFELLPLRGFAASLWDDLALASAEFA